MIMGMAVTATVIMIINYSNGSDNDNDNDSDNSFVSFESCFILTNQKTWLYWLCFLTLDETDNDQSR